MIEGKATPAQKSIFAALLGMIVMSACGAPGANDGNTTPPDDPPCACAVGAKRCLGNQIQVCEATTPECPSWGPATACPGAACANDSCGTNCTDACVGGTTQCAGNSSVEVCRIGPSGCLEWVGQACPAAQFCGGNVCQAAIPCDPACPAGYMCQPSGICAGGSPSSLSLDVKAVQVSGKVTLNGATPMRGSDCTAYPTVSTSELLFTEVTKGYVFNLSTKCSDSTFSFSGRIYPGTYRVRVNGNTNRSYDFSNIPVADSAAQSYVANANLVASSDVSGVVLDVKTVNVGGKITLNGALPMRGSDCPAYPTVATSDILFTETTKGYVFNLSTRCSDSAFAWSGRIYPGTYSVRVNGNTNRSYDFSNIPIVDSTTLSYVANANLTASSDVSGLVLDVKAINIGGKITLNGATPVRGSDCPAYPTVATSDILFTETTKGYVFSLSSRCSDSMFGWSGRIYPGTYAVRVNGNTNRSYDFSNLPIVDSTALSYVVNASLAASSDVSNLTFDVKAINVSGKVTLNGAAPMRGSDCPAYPTVSTSELLFTEATKKYVFSLVTRCADSTFSFSGKIYPGTYRAQVNGNTNRSYDFSNIPIVDSTAKSYVANASLAASADVSGVVLDVKSVNIGGKITLNGATPVRGSDCTAYPTVSTSELLFTEPAKGYVFSLASKCSDSTFSFGGRIYPGTYSVRVNGNTNRSYDFSNIPIVDSTVKSYEANASLVASADVSGVVLDVKSVNVGGQVTLNGARPQLGSDCSSYPTVSTSDILFVEPTRGYAFSLASKCSDSTFSFSGRVYPGTYSVRVNGNTNRSYDFSNIPIVDSTALSYLTIARILIP